MYTRIEPAGAGGASGACFNCDATNWAEGGRWRRSRHLRRVQRPRQGGMEMISFPYRIRFKFPFLSDLFSENRNEFCPKLVQKVRRKKLNKQQTTHSQTDRLWPIQSSSGAVFWTAKSQIPLADVSKTCSQNDLRIPVKIPFKEHLRLASVVALSSSGACGANNRKLAASVPLSLKTENIEVHFI